MKQILANGSAVTAPRELSAGGWVLLGFPPSTGAITPRPQLCIASLAPASQAAVLSHTAGPSISYCAHRALPIQDPVNTCHSDAR